MEETFGTVHGCVSCREGQEANNRSGLLLRFCMYHTTVTTSAAVPAAVAAVSAATAVTE